MNNCEAIRKRILDLDNECDPLRDAAVADHLAGCDACRHFHADIRRVWESLDSVPVLAETPGFNRAVWSRIEARRKRTPLRLLTFTFLPPPLRAAAWAAVLVAAVTAGLLVYDAGRRPVPGPDTAVTLTSADRQDDQMLMELDALINFDESQVFSTYQDWKMTPAGKEKTPVRPEDPKPEPRPQPEEPRLNRNMQSTEGWINQA